MKSPRVLQKSFLIGSFILLFTGGIFWFAQEAQGVNRTWDCGGGDSSWNNDLNWSGDTEPGASDVAIFDTTCTNNVTIDKSISVAGISINAGYTGTITQSSTFTVTVGSSQYSQAAGTFTGGSGTIDINGTFTLSGGAFTSTSGTLEVGRSASSETFFTISGGTFSHNSGTVTFAPNDLGNGGNFFTIDVATSLTLYNIIIDCSCSVGSSALEMGSGDTVIAANNFTHTNGKLNGAWEVQGNVTIGSGADGGGGTATMTGTGSKTYSYTAGGTGPHLRVNNASLTVTPLGGTTALTISLFSLLAGSFTAPTGTMTIGRSASSETFFTISGGTFSHNSGTVTFAPNDLGNGGNFFTIDVATSLTLYNIIIDCSCSVGSSALEMGSGDTVIAANNFTHTNGKLNGAWEVQGNVTIGSGADGGTATVTYTGGNNQTYTDQGGDEPNGDITINKTPGSSVRQASNADWNASGQDLTITSGELNMGASYNISTTSLTVSTDGHLSNFGTGDLTLGGTLTNSGVVRLESSGTCGSTDDILIRSSSTGVQRSWNGSGTFQLYDVDVRDMAGSASLTLYSSTSTANNGGNWTFSGAACPAQAPAAQLNSGVINFGSGVYRLP